MADKRKIRSGARGLLELAQLGLDVWDGIEEGRPVFEAIGRAWTRQEERAQRKAPPSRSEESPANPDPIRVTVVQEKPKT